MEAGHHQRDASKARARRANARASSRTKSRLHRRKLQLVARCDQNVFRLPSQPVRKRVLIERAARICRKARPEDISREKKGGRHASLRRPQPLHHQANGRIQCRRRHCGIGNVGPRMERGVNPLEAAFHCTRICPQYATPRLPERQTTVLAPQRFPRRIICWGFFFSMESSRAYSPDADTGPSLESTKVASNRDAYIFSLWLR